MIKLPAYGSESIYMFSRRSKCSSPAINHPVIHYQAGYLANHINSMEIFYFQRLPKLLLDASITARLKVALSFPSFSMARFR